MTHKDVGHEDNTTLRLLYAAMARRREPPCLCAGRTASGLPQPQRQLSRRSSSTLDMRASRSSRVFCAGGGTRTGLCRQAYPRAAQTPSRRGFRRRVQCRFCTLCLPKRALRWRFGRAVAGCPPRRLPTEWRLPVLVG